MAQVESQSMARYQVFYVTNTPLQAIHRCNRGQPVPLLHRRWRRRHGEGLQPAPPRPEQGKNLAEIKSSARGAKSG